LIDEAITVTRPLGGKQSNAAAPTTRRRQRTVLSDGPHPIDIYVGSRIRHQRALAGLNQTQLAMKVGVTFQSIQKYERGTNRVSASRLQQIATALNVPVSQFFDGLATESAVRPGTPPVPEHGPTTREIHDLNLAFTAIADRTVRRAFLYLMRSAAGMRELDDDGAPTTGVN
jgi:transcriptional regulator with XRE-family HTH domain